MPRGTRGVGFALFFVLAAVASGSLAGTKNGKNLEISAAQDKKNPILSELEDNPRLLIRISLGFYQRGLYIRALPLLKVFVRKYPNHPEHKRAVFMLADSHYFVGNSGVFAEFENAAKAYVLALSLYPDSPQMPGAYFRLGQVYKATKKFGESIVAFRTLVEKAPESPQAPKALLEVASRYIEINDPQSAVVEYGKILERYKGTLAEREAYFGIANALSKKKLFNEALNQFENAMKRWPEHLMLRPDLQFGYSETLFQARHFKKAEKYFLRMVNISPSSGFTNRALARLGDIRLELGDMESAAKIYLRVVSKYPKTEGAWVSLIRMADLAVDNKFIPSSGWVFLNNPLRNPVEAYWRVVREASENRLSHVAYMRIANYYLKKEELRKSILALKQFLERNPTTPLINNAHLIMARAYFGEVEKFFNRRQFLRAILTYAEFRSLVPKEVSLEAKPFWAMMDVGESYLKLGLYEKADKLFREVMADPRGVLSVGGEAIFRLTQSALLSGKIGNAKVLAGQFIKRFPNGKRSSSIRAILGEIAWLEGQPRQSISQLEKGLKGELDNELRGRSLFVLSEAYSEVFRFGESVEALRKAIGMYSKIPGQVKPFSLEKARFRLGDLLYEGRQKVGALVAYKEALEAYPKSQLSGWALHRISRIQAELKLAGKVNATVGGYNRRADGPVDPFWREINQVRSASVEWDKTNRPRLEKILKKGFAN